MKTEKTVDFGFRKVASDEKSGLVREVFSSVASKYDIMNDLMSGGLHRPWKNRMVSMLRPFNDIRLLDLAGGTGDIAFRFHEKAQGRGVKANITVCDINEEMLREGRNRAVDRNILDIDWQVGDAENLPFEDNSFDYCTIAFGIRNVTDIPQALNEIHRILKPGGRFVCLEFSHIDNDILAKVYDQYSFKVIPQIGRMITGDRDPYQYLVESIRKFPNKDDFAEMITAAGFQHVDYQVMTHGVVAIHSGWKGK